MYNRYRYHPKFKRRSGDNVLKLEMEVKKELNEYKREYEKLFSTVENLLECREVFSKYLKDNGDHEPLHRFSSKINKKGNYMLSVFGLGFIPTNQTYAKRVKEIIDKAEENKEDLDSERVILNAVIAIKEVDDEMAKENITGRVKKGIEALLKKFKLDKNFQEKKLLIEVVLEYIEEYGNEGNEPERVISPTFEYESSSFGKSEKKQNSKAKRSKKPLPIKGI